VHPAVAEPPSLIVVADDYGYAPAYDEGILEAAGAGALDAVSVMVLREPDPESLLSSEVEIGLHLEPITVGSLAEQLDRFELLFGHAPSHLDGHHHCHAKPGRTALGVARLGRRLGMRVRSVNPRHRRLLRCLGVHTNDRLVGRIDEQEAALPEAIRVAIEDDVAQPGLTEWMVHPGHSDATSGSSYDAGREEDLRLVINLASDERLRRLRAREGPQFG
jgi:predicted glycoside hydrolase/deacetylase ChbG (UPF0249 family)